MAEKKIYVGSGKKKSDTWFKATINPEKLMEHITEFKGNKMVKLDINIYDEPDQYGKDVKITIDTWNPGGNQQSSVKPKSEPVKDCPQPEAEDEDEDDSLPF